MLWLALHFASLPLEVYARAGHASAAVAIADGAHTIVACNEAALKLGIRRGMPHAAASALSSELHVVPRDIAAEEAALERIAAWAIQFTPAVSIVRPAEVLLEVAGSLTIFRGLKHLWTEVQEGLRALGFSASIACAPTPLAAQWFARAGLPVRLRHGDALRASLPDLPIAVTQAAPEALALLDNVGAKNVSDCLALPRDGLARRLGQPFLDDLDRALGALPDPRAFFVPPTVFKAAQLLPAPAHEADMLVFVARRLLNELCGFLAATANGAQCLTFTFSHHKLEPTKLTLSLVEATRDVEHLTNVLRERLDRTTLRDPVTALALESELLLPLASRNLSLLPDAGQLKEAATHLVERLRARLGDDAVQGLTRYADHRPERAWRTCEPGTHDAVHTLIASRPLWLLERPLPLSEVGGVPYYDGRLSRLTRAERIESGWWDGHDVMRDYFVACNPAEALLWVYQERNPGGGWFLHGFFA
jgi:protein ImuB